MRPKKRILLAGAIEDQVGVLKFMLSTNGLAVETALSAAEARTMLAAAPYDLLFCAWPLPGIEELLDRAHSIQRGLPRLVLAERLKQAPADLIAESVLTGPYCPATEILERVKFLVQRKRGPKPQRKKPVASVGAPAAASVEGRCA